MGEDVDRETAKFAWARTEFMSEDKATGVRLLHTVLADVVQLASGRYALDTKSTWILDNGCLQVELRGEREEGAENSVTEVDLSVETPGSFSTATDAVAAARHVGATVVPRMPSREADSSVLSETVQHRRDLARLGVDAHDTAAIAALWRYSGRQSPGSAGGADHAAA